MNLSGLRRWDIFCRVIDNYGDIGVSWRLARQLASEHGVQVRLWVDHIESLQALCPHVNSKASRQRVDGVTIFDAANETGFTRPADVVTDVVPDVVLEAFGCGLPPAYVTAMAARAKPPRWIILEYLSAEPWVREHHGLPSPHPQLNLPRYFFFPGFTEGTGGVLREHDLLARRDAFDARARRAYWPRLGFDAVPDDTLAVSLFAYAHAPYAALLQACANGAQPVVMAIPAGPLSQAVRDHLQCGEVDRVRRGNLEVRFVPFVAQADYDALLWACDVNFVRGEDSFVRAQWARRPFVWHIYPQAQSAHQVKLDAFLEVYCAQLPAPAAQAVRGFWHAWNAADSTNSTPGVPPLADAWNAFIRERQAQQRHLLQWADSLERLGDMAGNLLKFCRKMI